MSIESFNRLVKLTARAFYDNISTKGDNQFKTSRSDNRGMAVVILDALTRRQWVREEDLAKDLKLHLKQLRRTLGFFQEEKLVMRDDRKEGLLNALGRVFPEAEHRNCAKHIYNNLCKSYKGDELKGVFWEAYSSYCAADFQAAMNNMKRLCPEAAEAFIA